MKCHYCQADEDRGNDLEQCEKCFAQVCDECRNECQSCGQTLCNDCADFATVAITSGVDKGELWTVCPACKEELQEEGLIDED